jgi:hypothetical protein
MENHPSRNRKQNSIVYFIEWFFLVKQVPGQGPEQREFGKTVIYPLIIITLINYIIIYYYQTIELLIKMRTIPAETGNGTLIY